MFSFIATIAAALSRCMIRCVTPPVSARTSRIIVDSERFEANFNGLARSLMPEHLIDVVSTDKHTVKPWFPGHADVSPAVADFEMQGYKLIGGRADYLGHQRVAVVVYQRGSHIINVFSWDANQSALPRNLSAEATIWLFGNPETLHIARYPIRVGAS
jgi:anti-sigma factor RsiW